jgi:hypothetical protein
LNCPDGHRSFASDWWLCDLTTLRCVSVTAAVFAQTDNLVGNAIASARAPGGTSRRLGSIRTSGQYA